jgi:uncharacterized protein YkwD
MQKNFFFFLGVVAALAVNSFAQANNFQTTASVNVGDIAPDKIGRPRVVAEKASGVEASVIVNTLSLERIAFDLLNQKRVENGFAPLAWNDQLAGIARLHSHNMAELNFFSHRGLDNKMVSDRADDNGIGKWHAIGENIAFNRGYQDPIGKAVELWLDSPSHKRNLLDSGWKETAVGVALAADGSYYLTQVFLKR